MLKRTLSLLFPLLFSLAFTASQAYAETANSNTTGIGGVDHVGLVVKDLEASKKLFTDILGFRVRGQDKNYPAYFLTNDQATITLWQAKDPAKAIAFNRKNNIGLHHLALRVASHQQLDALYQRLKDYPGARVEFAPELAYGGPDRHMMFFGPSGNRIELVVRGR